MVSFAPQPSRTASARRTGARRDRLSAPPGATRSSGTARLGHPLKNQAVPRGGYRATNRSGRSDGPHHARAHTGAELPPSRVRISGKLGVWIGFGKTPWRACATRVRVGYVESPGETTPPRYALPIHESKRTEPPAL